MTHPTGPDSVAAELERYRPALLRLARELDQRDAEDLLQDAICKALRKANQCRGRSVLHWARTIVQRTAIDRHRCAGRTPEPMGMLQDEHTTDDLNMAEIAGRNNDIERALIAVGPVHAAWLVMVRDGYTYKQIAARYNIPVWRVRNGLVEARRTARELGE